MTMTNKRTSICTTSNNNSLNQSHKHHSHYGYHHPSHSRRLLTVAMASLACLGLASRTIWQSLYLTSVTITTTTTSTYKYEPTTSKHGNSTAPTSAMKSNKEIPLLEVPSRGVRWLDWQGASNATVVADTKTSNSPSWFWLPTKGSIWNHDMQEEQKQSTDRPVGSDGLRRIEYPMSRSFIDSAFATTITSSSRLREFERPFYEDCDPILEDVHIHPTCNSIHELNFATTSSSISLLSMAGSWRSVWKLLPSAEDDDFFSRSNATSTNPLDHTSHTQQEKGPPIVSSQQLILKVLKMDLPFDMESLNVQQTDSIVMDRLTASPHVISSYGFCGSSTVTEFASQSGRETLKETTLTFRTRLRLARDLARGLAELHASLPLSWDDDDKQQQHHQSSSSRNYKVGHDRYEDSSTNERYDSRLARPVIFAHHDINIANIVRADRDSVLTVPNNTIGNVDVEPYNTNTTKKKTKKKKLPLQPERDQKNVHIQWNDFNLGIWLRKPSKSSSISSLADSDNSHHCWAPVRYEGPLWRSPEEIANSSTVEVDQSDVYSFGNLLFQLLTKRQPWTHLEINPTKPPLDAVGRAKQLGQFPRLPDKYHNDTSQKGSSSGGRVEKLVLYEAIQACYRFHPRERPTAHGLAHALGTAYNWLEDENRRKHYDAQVSGSKKFMRQSKVSRNDEKAESLTLKLAKKAGRGVGSTTLAETRHETVSLEDIRQLFRKPPTQRDTQ